MKVRHQEVSRRKQASWNNVMSNTCVMMVNHQCVLHTEKSKYVDPT
jgi:hypothetical protein